VGAGTVHALGGRIKIALQRRGWDQSDLARKMNVSRATVSRWASNSRAPSPDTLREMADLLNVSIDWLTGRTDDPSPPDPYPDFDPLAEDWYDHAPDWLREMYDDPEYRPYIEREDVRRVLLDPSTWVMYRAKNRPKKEVRLDVLKFIAWRLDQEKDRHGE